MMIIENEFEIGQIVYLKTDPDQFERMITALHIYGGGSITYSVACGDEVNTAYGFELSLEKDLTKVG